MKIAVVGATGVLGQALVPLLAQSDHSVLAVARSTAKAKALYSSLKSVEIVECDLLAPQAETCLRAALQGCQAIAHVATAIPRNMSVPSAWEANTRLRTEGVRLLLQICQEMGIKRYLQQSITMAYPDHGPDWIYEDCPLDPSPERALICAPIITMESLVQSITPGQLEWCILRGGEFVGPGTFQEATITNLLAGRETLSGTGNNYVSLIHVGDMATAFATALTRAPAGTILNIVDEPLTQKDYKTQLAARINAVPPQFDATARTPFSWRCSNQAAKTILEWSPMKGVYPR